MNTRNTIKVGSRPYAIAAFLLAAIGLVGFVLLERERWMTSLGISGNGSSELVLADELLVQALAPKNQIPFPGPDAEIFVASGVGGEACQDLMGLDSCSYIRQCHDRLVQGLEIKLRDPKLTPSDRIDTLALRAQREWYWARDPLAAIRWFEEALQLAMARTPPRDASPKQTSPAVTREWILLAQLGVSWLRFGELRNCVDNHNSDSCLFPLSKLAQHRHREGAQKAVKYFETALRIRATSHLVWLFNIAHQALGSPQNEIPKPWRLPRSALVAIGSGSEPDGLKRMDDFAEALGLQSRQDTGGSNGQAQDFDGDGRLDLILGGRHACSPMKYYRGTAEGFENLRFEPNAKAVIDSLGVTNVLAGDIDNDGDLDLYLVRGGWVKWNSGAKIFNELLINQGKGRFEKLSSGPLNPEGNRSVAALFSDFDLDGWLDLFVCDEAQGPELYRGGRMGFRRTVKNGGITYQGVCKGAAAGDLDGDGRAELFLALYGQNNQLYRNRSNQEGIRFELDLKSEVSDKPHFAFPAAFADLNNDSHLDLVVGSYYRDVANYSRFVLGKRYVDEVSRIFLNDGQGQLEDRTAMLKFSNPAPVMGMGIADLNGDGWLDILLGTGSVSFGDLVPNLVFVNRGGREFVELGRELGMSSLQKGHGVVTGDLDGDLRSDILWVNGGTIPGDNFFPSVYRNSSNQNQWIGLELEGVTSNRSAIGAKVVIEVEAPEGRAEGRADGPEKPSDSLQASSVIQAKSRSKRIVRLVGSNTSFGSESLRLNIGLGRINKINRLTIHWPNSRRTVDSYSEKDGITAGKLIRVREGGRPIEIASHRSNWPTQALDNKAATKHHHEHEHDHH